MTVQLPLTYARCAEALGGRPGAPLANNTRLERVPQQDGPDAYAVRLHSTNILTFYSDGRVRLETGGWPTATTKDRLGYGPWTVYSERKAWRIAFGSAGSMAPDWGGAVPFPAGGLWAMIEEDGTAHPLELEAAAVGVETVKGWDR